MSCQLTKTALKERTQQYWEKRPGYDCYIKELLGRELQHVKSLQDSIERLRDVGKPVHTLALTVGESFEPLLQVVCVLRPKRVVLILNSVYGGTPGSDHGKDLKQFMLKLSQADWLPEEEMRPELKDCDFDLVELANDTPTQVFRALRKAMQKAEAEPPEGSTNVVDITGAKKSMVVGAFLYAAHSGLPITYVDFDKYDTQWGRPYGYTCRIGEIANPYEAFRLRDWEQVRRLYASYSFRNARMLLGERSEIEKPGAGIMGAMSQKLDGSTDDPLFDPGDTDKVIRLAAMFKMYEAWENGDYASAISQKNSFIPPLPPDVVPWSVDELGGVWPTVVGIPDARKAADALLNAHLALKQGASQPADSLFAQPAKLLAYVRDELAKIERLITNNEDYRSAFLRAAGLHEFLLKARLALCWLNKALEAKPKGSATWQPVTAFGSSEPAAFASLMEESSEWKFRKALQSGSQEEMSVTGGNIRRTATAPSMKPYFDDLVFDLKTAIYTAPNGDARPLFIKLRGEAIHTHLYIPRPIAEAALDLVHAAAQEFETNWLKHFHADSSLDAANRIFEAPSWTRLCDVCELTFLPPRLRNDLVQEV